MVRQQDYLQTNEALLLTSEDGRELEERDAPSLPPFFPWIYNSENYTRFLESDLEYQIKASERKGFTV